MLFLLVFFMAPSFAQTIPIKFQTPGSFIVKKQQLFHLPVSEFSVKQLPDHFNPGNNNFHFDKAVHYSAFFCKMELKAVDHCNVWIKLHAGDYDAYTKNNLPQ
jgi:hypothetical protein